MWALRLLLIYLLTLRPVYAGFFENNNSSYNAPSGDDTMPVSDSATAMTWRAVPDCQDTVGKHLNYTASSNSFSCGTSQSSIGGLWMFDGGSLSTTAVRYFAQRNMAVTSSAVCTSRTTWVAPVSGTLKNLYCQISTAISSGTSYSLALYGVTEGAATGLTCTITGSSATQCHETSSNLSIVAGQCYAVQATPSGTPPAAIPFCTVEYDF